jgi:hypothetical protein
MNPFNNLNDFFEKTELKIKASNDTQELRDIMDNLKLIRSELLVQFSDEDSKSAREEMHDQLFTIKTLTHQAKSKIMAIAHTKIVKPSFIR